MWFGKYIPLSASLRKSLPDLVAKLFVGTRLQALLQRKLVLVETSREAISNLDRSFPHEPTPNIPLHSTFRVFSPGHSAAKQSICVPQQ